VKLRLNYFRNYSGGEDISLAYRGPSSGWALTLDHYPKLDTVRGNLTVSGD
jgi:hypothetical protein